VRTTGGNAVPAANVGTHYDDCYAHITGFENSPNQQVDVTIYKGSASAGETEILLRVTDTPTTVSCYECLFNVGGGIAIVRWNGPVDDFTYLNTSPVFDPVNSATIVDGDKLRATIVGSTINFYFISHSTGTPVLMISATDSQLTTGNPGIGFFQRSPGSLDYGFADFSATGL
jgi:hypothetical protein